MNITPITDELALAIDKNRNDMVKNANSRTNADPDEVFNFCDALKSKNEPVTVAKVAEHFSASNTTVGPIVAEWKKVRANQPAWPMPVSLGDRAQELAITIWLLACETGQAQLHVEASALTSMLEAERAKLSACTRIQETLQEQLDQKSQSLVEVEAQLMEATQSTLDLTHKLELAERDLAQLKEELALLQPIKHQVHETQLHLAKLEGQNEELRRQQALLAAKQEGAV